MHRGVKPQIRVDSAANEADNQAKMATAAEMKACGLPYRPVWMDKDTLGQYRKAFAILARRNVISSGDAMTFLAMFRHFQTMRQAQEEMASGSLMTVDERGMARKTPLAQVYKDNSLAFLRYAVEFGLTPSSRNRSGIAAEHVEMDEMEKLLQTGG